MQPRAVTVTYREQVHHRYITGTSPVHHRYITGTSQVHHRYITGTSQVHHRYITGTSQVHHRYITGTSQVHHRYITGTSQVHHKLGARLSYYIRTVGAGPIGRVMAGQSPPYTNLLTSQATTYICHRNMYYSISRIKLNISNWCTY